MHTLITKTDDRGVLTLTMCRPGVFNAFNADMISEMTMVLKAAASNDDVRLIVVTGSGTCFSAGADLNWMRSLVNASLEENEADAMCLARLMRCLNYLPKPTIAMVNGAAYGGGVGLVAACDIRITVEGALFGLTEARLGLAPAVISPYVIRCIGESNARRLFLSGERFAASEAQRIGLVDDIVAPDLLESRVEQTISQLLQSGPAAVKQCKQLVFDIVGHNRKTQKSIDEHTSRLIASLRVSTEGQEGLTAFLDKRKPDWVDK